MNDLIIIGAGPAGMLAAYAAAARGIDTLLLEKMEKFVKNRFFTEKDASIIKINFIIGDFFSKMGKNEKFL